MYLFDTWMKSEMKHDITKTFIKLGNTPESIDSDDIRILVFLVKSVYYRNGKNIETGASIKWESQFTQSNLKWFQENRTKFWRPLHWFTFIKRATHAAGFEWVECLHNVSIPDPSVRSYILKNDSEQRSVCRANVPGSTSQVYHCVYVTGSAIGNSIVWCLS